METNSALEWLPKIEEAGLPVPHTKIIPYTHADIVKELEGGKSNTLSGTRHIFFTTCNLIGYPCFVRTDLASAKHEGESSYLIKKADDILNVILKTVEDNEVKFWMSEEQPKAFLVREFLNLDAPFTAFGGLPIARE
jgi:hypothetical protein